MVVPTATLSADTSADERGVRQRPAPVPVCPKALNPRVAGAKPPEPMPARLTKGGESYARARRGTLTLECAPDGVWHPWATHCMLSQESFTLFYAFRNGKPYASAL